MTFRNSRNLQVEEMRYLQGLGPGNDIYLLSHLSVGDRPGLSEIVLPYFAMINFLLHHSLHIAGYIFYQSSFPEEEQHKAE